MIDPEVAEANQDQDKTTDAADAVGDFQAIEPDIAEAKQLGDGATPAEVVWHAKELRSDGRNPPVGWRQDVFGTRRPVWVPPWSLRPPTIEPEPWLSLTQKYKDEARRRWQAQDPKGFAEQERRRNEYLKMKKKVVTAAPAPAVRLDCNSAEAVYGAPYDETLQDFDDDFADLPPLVDSSSDEEQAVEASESEDDVDIAALRLRRVFLPFRQRASSLRARLQPQS